jgi:hypothetical protein
MQDLMCLQHICWRFKPSGMLHRVGYSIVAHVANWHLQGHFQNSSAHRSTWKYDPPLPAIFILIEFKNRLKDADVAVYYFCLKNTIKWWKTNILACANISLYCGASETAIGCWVWSYVNMAQRTKDVNLLKPRNENCRFRFTYCLRTTSSQ